jgi:hypothetical protein
MPLARCTGPYSGPPSVYSGLHMHPLRHCDLAGPRSLRILTSNTPLVPLSNHAFVTCPTYFKAVLNKVIEDAKGGVAPRSVDLHPRKSPTKHFDAFVVSFQKPSRHDPIGQASLVLLYASIVHKLEHGNAM